MKIKQLAPDVCKFDSKTKAVQWKVSGQLIKRKCDIQPDYFSINFLIENLTRGMFNQGATQIFLRHLPIVEKSKYSYVDIELDGIKNKTIKF